METKGLICTAAAVAVLLGCATPSLAPARKACNSGQCDVDIHIDKCVIAAPDIDVYQATNIFWNIDAASKQAGYTFPDESVHLGVWIKDPPNGQFDSPERLNDWKFKLHDKNTSSGKGSYRYGVEVVNGQTTCPDLDPSIVNH